MIFTAVIFTIKFYEAEQEIGFERSMGNQKLQWIEVNFRI